MKKRPGFGRRPPSFPGGEEAVPVLAYKEGSAQKSNLF